MAVKQLRQLITKRRVVWYVLDSLAQNQVVLIALRTCNETASTSWQEHVGRINCHILSPKEDRKWSGWVGGREEAHFFGSTPL